MLMLSRIGLARSGAVLMLFRTLFGGRGLMLVLFALRRRSLMLMRGFGSFFGQVRRDGFDAKGLDPGYFDWWCGPGKGTGRVFAANHHGTIPCPQGADTQ
jgi:hypothetical protein